MLIEGLSDWGLVIDWNSTCTTWEKIEVGDILIDANGSDGFDELIEKLGKPGTIQLKVLKDPFKPLPLDLSAGQTLPRGSAFCSELRRTPAICNSSASCTSNGTVEEVRREVSQQKESRVSRESRAPPEASPFRAQLLAQLSRQANISTQEKTYPHSTE